MTTGARVYRGERFANGTVSVTVNGVTLEPRPSQKLWNHSPDGFNWGYGGSGPAQLALAILLDVTKDSEVALSHYQAFKRQYVAHWDEVWAIDDVEVRAWLAASATRHDG